MGRRGFPAAPTAVKLAKGETRPSRVNYESPVPRQRDPKMPKGMAKEAQTVWRRVLREMKGTGVILGADADILRAYCEACASYARNVVVLRESGPLVRGARGAELIVNPLSRVVREDRDAIRLLARELGLSPAARAGLRIDMSAETADMDDILGPQPRLRVLAEETG